MQSLELDERLSDPSHLPVRVTQWNDRESSATAWLVIDRRVNGVAGGGIFMGERATAEETADIARTMTKKFLFCEPRIGGAKAGIRFAGKDPTEREGVLRRFLTEMRADLQNGWVTAGDYGTSDELIQKMVLELAGHDMQWALYRLAAHSQETAQYLSRRAADLYFTDVSRACQAPEHRLSGLHTPLIEAANPSRYDSSGVIAASCGAAPRLEP